MKRKIGIVFLGIVIINAVVFLWPQPDISAAPWVSEYTGDYDGIYDGDYELHIEPRSALTDTPVTIRASGLNAGQVVTLRARMTDANTVDWESKATFRANSDGAVDPATMAPLAGTYQDLDAHGLFWSMQPRGLPRDDWALHIAGLDRMTITFTLEAAGRELAKTEIERLYPWSEGYLDRQDIREDGLMATLWSPQETANLPAIITLGGSGGGSMSTRSSLLAARGFVVLNLFYFGREGLPEDLAEVPLEYCAKAIRWLQKQPTVDGERIGVYGASKGAELALLLASQQPEIRSVVAYVPSSVVWQGIRWSWPPAGSSWSRDGEPMAYVPLKSSLNVFWKAVTRRPMAVGVMYAEGLRNLEAVERATIPVEDIQGAVLLVSGGDDQVWPSMEMGRQIVKRLEEHDFPHPYQHLAFEKAGHRIGVPHFPRYRTRVRLLGGGSPPVDAAASAEAWAEALRFFQRHLFFS